MSREPAILDPRMKTVAGSGGPESPGRLQHSYIDVSTNGKQAEPGIQPWSFQENRRENSRAGCIIQTQKHLGWVRPAPVPQSGRRRIVNKQKNKEFPYTQRGKNLVESSAIPKIMLIKYF